MFALSVVDSRFKAWSGQTKDYAIDMRFFYAKYAAIRNNNKYWLARSLAKMFDWSDMSTRELLFRSASTVNIHACSILILYFYLIFTMLFFFIIHMHVNIDLKLFSSD